MKANIREKVSGSRIRDAVPPAYRDAAAKLTRPDNVYTLILCDHGERDIVMFAPLERALRRMGEPAPGGVLIVGTVFTEEAQALAHEHKARIISLRTGKWTDSSARQRQLKPAPVRRPATRKWDRALDENGGQEFSGQSQLDFDWCR